MQTSAEDCQSYKDRFLYVKIVQEYNDMASVQFGMVYRYHHIANDSLNECATSNCLLAVTVFFNDNGS